MIHSSHHQSEMALDMPKGVDDNFTFPVLLVTVFLIIRLSYRQIFNYCLNEKLIISVIIHMTELELMRQEQLRLTLIKKEVEKAKTFHMENCRGKNFADRACDLCDPSKLH